MCESRAMPSIWMTAAVWCWCPVGERHWSINICLSRTPSALWRLECLRWLLLSIACDTCSEWFGCRLCWLFLVECWQSVVLWLDWTSIAMKSRPMRTHWPCRRTSMLPDAFATYSPIKLSLACRRLLLCTRLLSRIQILRTKIAAVWNWTERWGRSLDSYSVSWVYWLGPRIFYLLSAQRR